MVRNEVPVESTHPADTDDTAVARAALTRWNHLKASGADVPDWPTFWETFKTETVKLPTKKTSAETSDVSEAKVPDVKQFPAEVIEHHAFLELKNKKSRLEYRKDCLCAGIARDIRFVGIETISDWMNRISKDIDSWRIDLSSLESEIASIDAELTMFGKLGELKQQLESITTVEAELMENLRLVHIERSQIRSKVRELTRNMNSLLSRLGDSSADLLVEPVDEKSMNSLVTDPHILQWDHSSDSGFLDCNLCNTRFSVHGFHTCAIPNEPVSAHVICPRNPAGVAELLHQPTDHFAPRPINDGFADGQKHCSTCESIESQILPRLLMLQTSSAPVETSDQPVETGDQPAETSD